MMKIAILEGLIMLFIYMGVAFFLRFTTIDRFGSNYIVKMHPAYLFVGIFATALFFILTLILAIKSRDLGSFILLAFAILSIALIIAYYKCRLFYDEQSITFRNFFGKKKTILYSDVIDVVNGMDTIIKTERDMIKIPNYMVGRFDLLLTMAPHLSSKLEKKTQRIVKKPAVRAFRDSVWRPSEFIFVYSLLGVLSVGIVLMCACLPEARPALWFAIILAAFVFGIIFLSIHSAKRAHSSEFWHGVAKICFKDGYLEP